MNTDYRTIDRDINIIVDRNFSPERSISISVTSFWDLRYLAEMFRNIGPENLYENGARIEAERDDFETDSIDSSNFKMDFLDENEVDKPTITVVVTSKDELIACRELLCREYFGWE